MSAIWSPWDLQGWVMKGVHPLHRRLMGAGGELGGQNRPAPVLSIMLLCPSWRPDSPAVPPEPGLSLLLAKIILLGRDGLKK